MIIESLLPGIFLVTSFGTLCVLVYRYTVEGHCPDADADYRQVKEKTPEYSLHRVSSP